VNHPVALSAPKLKYSPTPWWIPLTTERNSWITDHAAELLNLCISTCGMGSSEFWSKSTCGWIARTKSGRANPSFIVSGTKALNQDMKQIYLETEIVTSEQVIEINIC
jgi:hypothetical protein